MPEMRVLLLTPRQMPEEAASALLPGLEDALRRHWQRVDAVPIITLSRADWQKNYSRLGSWDAWERDVAQGIRYLDRQPNYHVFVCIQTDVGKSTAHVLNMALQAKKPVLYLDLETRHIDPVIRVCTVDPENFVSGWMIECP